MINSIFSMSHDTGGKEEIVSNIPEFYIKLYFETAPVFCTLSPFTLFYIAFIYKL